MDNLHRIGLGIILVLLVLNVALILNLVNPGLTGYYLVEERVNFPMDRIEEREIVADAEGVLIQVENPVLSRYEDSGSMVPVIGFGSTGIGIRPEYEGDISVGDIISFYEGERIIVHRVISVGEDEEGMYFITKGDNNNLDDGKIRFPQIDSVLVAIVY